MRGQAASEQVARVVGPIHSSVGAVWEIKLWWGPNWWLNWCAVPVISMGLLTSALTLSAVLSTWDISALACHASIIA